MKEWWTISKSDVAGLLRFEMPARLREVDERISLFEQSYDEKFESFEQSVLGSEENFERWDDYIEWKAFHELRNDLQERWTP